MKTVLATLCALGALLAAPAMAEEVVLKPGDKGLVYDNIAAMVEEEFTHPFGTRYVRGDICYADRGGTVELVREFKDPLFSGREILVVFTHPLLRFGNDCPGDGRAKFLVSRHFFIQMKKRFDQGKAVSEALTEFNK